MISTPLTTWCDSDPAEGPVTTSTRSRRMASTAARLGSASKTDRRLSSSDVPPTRITSGSRSTRTSRAICFTPRMPALIATFRPPARSIISCSVVPRPAVKPPGK